MTGPAEMEAMARTVARETVKETFLALGVDTSSGKEVTEVQQDFAFMRTARLTTRKLRMHAITVALTLIVTAAGSALWLGFITKAGSAVAGK